MFYLLFIILKLIIIITINYEILIIIIIINFLFYINLKSLLLSLFSLLHSYYLYHNDPLYSILIIRIKNLFLKINYFRKNVLVIINKFFLKTFRIVRF